MLLKVKSFDKISPDGRKEVYLIPVSSISFCHYVAGGTACAGASIVLTSGETLVVDKSLEELDNLLSNTTHGI